MALLHSDPRLLADLDHHQRYLAASLLLRPLLEPLGRPARILEVGSNVLHLLPAFLAPFPVEVLRADVVDAPLPGSRFVRLDQDGRLPFPDEVFDFVVAMEVLEHIAKEDRPFALSEWTRVARQGVLFSCPRRSRAVRAAERRVDRHYRGRHGRPHPWLAEHEQFGIPSRAEIRAILGKLGLRAHAFGNTPLSEWLPLQMLCEELSSAPRSGLREHVQQVLNTRSFQPFTRRRPYRRLYLAFKNDETARRAVARWRQAELDFAPSADSYELDPVAHLAQELRRLFLAQPPTAALLKAGRTAQREQLFAVRRAELAERELAEVKLRAEALAHLGPRWQRWWRSWRQAWRRRPSLLPGAQAVELQPAPHLGPDGWEALGPIPHWVIHQPLPKGWTRFRVCGHGACGQAVRLYLDHGWGFGAEAVIELGHWDGPRELERFLYLPHDVHRWRLDPQAVAGPLRLSEVSAEPVPAAAVCLASWFGELTALLRGRGWRELRETWRSGGWRGLLRRPLDRLLTSQKYPASAHCSYEQFVAWRKPTAAQVANWMAECSLAPTTATLAVWLPILGPFHAQDLQRTLASLARHQSWPRWELGLSVHPQHQDQVQAELERFPELKQRTHLLVLPPGVERAADHLNALLDKHSSDFGVPIRLGDQVAEEGLLQLAVAMSRHPTCVALYTDEDRWQPGIGRHAPRFFPDWSPETFLAGALTGGLAAFRRSALRAVGGFAAHHEGAHELDLLARLAARHPTGIIHVPQVLLHRTAAAWEPAFEPTAVARVVAQHLDEGTLGPQGDVEFSGQQLRLRPRLATPPLVSIIIPTLGRPIRLDGRVTTHIDHLLQSLRKRTGYPRYEILVVDNGAVSALAADQLAQHDVRRVSILAPFNFAANLNRAAAKAQGELLLFLNDDMEVLHEEWLEELVRWASQRDIGAVGGKLYFADGRVQHAGIHLYEAGPGHPLYGASAQFQVLDPTFGQVRNVLAVTGACLMTPRTVFTTLGGFDESFVLNYNDVDYCLRVVQLGKRVVFTPHAELIHFERMRPDGRADFQMAELERFQQRWRRLFPRDPFLNVNFSPRHHDFRLDVQRAQNGDI